MAGQPAPLRMAVKRTGVLIFAKDLERLASFYGSVLGLTPRTTPDGGFVELLCDGQVALSLHALPPAIASQVALGDPPHAREDTAIKPCFEVDGLEAVREVVLAHGARAKDVWEWRGRAYCDCIDPEGNVFQLTSELEPRQT